MFSRQFLLLFICALFSFTFASAQYSIVTGNKKLIQPGMHKLRGWHFSPGLTYTFTKFKSSEETLLVNSDTTYRGTIEPNGRLGFYAEVGRYKIFKYGNYVHYMDYSLGFKELRGREVTSGFLESTQDQTIFEATESEGVFSEGFLLGNFNLNSIIQTSNYNFIQSSVGVNLDYKIMGSAESNGVSGAPQQFPGSLIGQLHYKLGYGFKVNSKLFIIPTLETPILSIYKWDDFKSALPYFSSRYRPILLTVRFAWLSRGGDACPPVDGNPGDKDRDFEYQQQKS